MSNRCAFMRDRKKNEKKLTDKYQKEHKSRMVDENPNQSCNKNIRPSKSIPKLHYIPTVPQMITRSQSKATDNSNNIFEPEFESCNNNAEIVSNYHYDSNSETSISSSDSDLESSDSNKCTNNSNTHCRNEYDTKSNLMAE
eukprot:35773_1